MGAYGRLPKICCQCRGGEAMTGTKISKAVSMDRLGRPIAHAMTKNCLA
jgi:hypothetical protein